MKNLYNFVILLVLIPSCYLYPQEKYQFTRYTTENGLSHNRVTGITQDKTGFLWIATWDGLCRFDGYEFKKYNHIPGDSTTIPHSILLNVFCDRYDNIWVFSDISKKVARYDRQNDNFITYTNKDSFGNFIKASLILTATLDDSLNLWVISEQGPERYNHSTDKFEIPITLLFPKAMFHNKC